MDRKSTIAWILSVFFIIGLHPSLLHGAERLTLDEVLSRALGNSREIKASQFEATAKSHQADQAGRWNNPAIELEKENKTGSEGDTTSWKVGLSQNIKLPGSYSKKEDVARAEARIADVERQETELKTWANVAALTFSFRAGEEKAHHAKERLERFQTVQTYLHSRVFASPQKQAEASIVTAKLLTLQKEFLHLQAEEAALWNNLNLYLKLADRPEISIVWYDKGLSLELPKLLEKADVSNLEVKKQRFKEVAAESALSLSRLEAWPDFTISASYSNGTGASHEKIYALGLSLPLPIFNFNGSAIDSAKFIHSAEIERVRFTDEKLAVEIKSAFSKYETEKESVKALSMQKLPSLEKDMSKIDQNFRRGQVDLLTYLEADSQHAESVSALYEAQVDFVKSFLDLQILTGEKAHLAE